MKPPPGHRWRPSRRVVARIVAALMPVLAISGCGLFPLGLPAAPETTPGPSADATAPTASPVPSGTASLETPSPSVASASPPTGLPSYPVPTERACALPADAPDSVAGADGPTLTVKRVAKAWRASEAGKSHGVKTGTQEHAATPPVSPGQVVVIQGAPWVALDIMEWSSVTTIVLADPGVAAAKLATVREMVRHPCSYRFGSSYVVARLSEDRPDLVQVTGMMEGYPMTDTFVRYGNTVTHAWMTLVPQDGDQIRTMVLDALAKA